MVAALRDQAGSFGIAALGSVFSSVRQNREITWQLDVAVRSEDNA